MIRAALGIAFALYVAFGVLVLKECAFLAPVKRFIWDQYSVPLLAGSAVLIVNLFCVCYAALRRIALEDTGGKLAHLEKQLRGGETISQELSARLEGK